MSSQGTVRLVKEPGGDGTQSHQEISRDEGRSETGVPIRSQTGACERKEKAKREGDFSSQAEESSLDTFRNEDKDESSLSIFLQRLGLTSQTICDMTRNRQSFGLAWYGISSIQKNVVPVVPLRSVDLSGSKGLSAKRVSLILDYLPASVEEMKVDSVLTKGPGLPLFLRFLNRVRAQHFKEHGAEGRAEEGGVKEAPRLKSFAFAAKSLGPTEASNILPLLLPLLVNLSLKGNLLDTEGFRSLAECIRKGNCSSLKSLDLQGTGLDYRGDGSELLCEALKECPLLVETLNLSDNDLQVAIDELCSVLFTSSLPHVRELGMARCKINEWRSGAVWEAMGKQFRDASSLVSLDLEGNEIDCESLKTIGGMLEKGVAPALRHLKLDTRREDWGLQFGEDRAEVAEAVSSFLRSLSSEKSPPLESIELPPLCGVSAESAEALGAGRYPAIRTLRMDLKGNAVVRFFRQAPQAPKFSVLDLRLTDPSNEGLVLLGSAIRMKRLDAIRDLWVNPTNTDEGGGLLAEGKNAFLTALAAVQLPNLSQLSMPHMRLTEGETQTLAQAVRAGNLPRLSILDLYDSGMGENVIGREGMELLMQAVVESDEGLPHLRQLDISFTAGGGGVKSLCTAVMSGKVGKLSYLNLEGSELNDEGVRGLAEVVREGQFSCLEDLNVSENDLVGKEAWIALMDSITESEVSLPRLKHLTMLGTRVGKTGVSLVKALWSGKVAALQSVMQEPWHLDQEGVSAVAEVVRAGKFPEGVELFEEFPLHLLREPDGPLINIDALLSAITDSERGLPGVSSLFLEGGTMGPEGMRSLVAGVRTGKLRLTSIVLKDCGLSDPVIIELAQGIRRGDLVRLRTLALSKNGLVTQKGIKKMMCAIIESEGGFPDLVQLSLPPGRAAGVPSVVDAVGSGKMPVLTNLSVEGLNSAGVVTLGGAVKASRLSQKLEGLEMVAMNTRVNLTAFLSGLEESENSLPNLKSLVMKGGEIGMKGVQSLAASIVSGKAGTLDRLWLTRCGITDRDLQLLAFAFRVNFCPKLFLLNLDRNKITSAGVREFVDCLRPESLPALTRLRVSVQELKARATTEGKLLRTTIFCPGNVSVQ
uniref:Uncharacterized protein n=1 Tax=Chromera velia CCMP2878 TaxID=1169474 RepID=A0A0G4HBG4_9ALVE|eukprot:Cvel_25983.t1-p1 / transcript=Cvel_25983.t1 / gene=Cvel_25983 / organism=Chromera_velia_CCMP2878 / gene_product=hypothetical protein / transcript_product=hypothetical protein / location=Cvel_scaffold3019:993-7079(-) / protein_length=1098 / sequence_SO=supercontig / SO=protein_coding / is_pseudo=false